MPVVSLSKVKMHYLDEGEGFPLVLITGLGGAAENWRGEIDYFKKHFRCICPDNRGVEGTTLPPGNLKISDMAEDVFELLEYLNIEKTHVLGLSMGGAITQELAISHPDKIEKLILSSTWCKSDPYLVRLFEVLSELVIKDFALYTEMLLLWCFDHNYYEKHLQDIKAIEEDRKNNPFPGEILATHCRACIQHDTLSRVGNIKAPALVTTGEKDILTPPEFAKILHKNIPGSRLVHFRNLGHLHLWEDPGKYRKEVMNFLEDQEIN